MLKDLKLNKNKVSVPYPGIRTFVVELAFIPRDEIAAMREKHLTISFNRLSKAKEETVDVDKFMADYISKAVVGWKGLTYEVIQKLVPAEIDESVLAQEIPFTTEDALWLVKNSSEFDSFISDSMGQAELFSVIKKEEQLKK